METWTPAYPMLGKTLARATFNAGQRLFRCQLFMAQIVDHLFVICLAPWRTFGRKYKNNIEFIPQLFPEERRSFFTFPRFRSSRSSNEVVESGL